MGPGDKSLANLPVTQLLAVVTGEPQRPETAERGAAKWKILLKLEQKVTSPLGQGNASSHTWRSTELEAFGSGFRTQMSQASWLLKSGRNSRAWRLGQTLKPFLLQAKGLFCG